VDTASKGKKRTSTSDKKGTKRSISKTAHTKKILQQALENKSPKKGQEKGAWEKSTDFLGPRGFYE